MKESPIFSKIFDFSTWVLTATSKFPREQRFIVAASLQQVILAAQEELIRAVHAQTVDGTLEHLHEAATQLALVKTYLRMSEKMQLITVKQYEYGAGCLDEIGRLYQGWKKTCLAQEAAKESITA